MSKRFFACILLVLVASCGGGPEGESTPTADYVSYDGFLKLDWDPACLRFH